VGTLWVHLDDEEEVRPGPGIPSIEPPSACPECMPELATIGVYDEEELDDEDPARAKPRTDWRMASMIVRDADGNHLYEHCLSSAVDAAKEVEGETFETVARASIVVPVGHSLAKLVVYPEGTILVMSESFSRWLLAGSETTPYPDRIGLSFKVGDKDQAAVLKRLFDLSLEEVPLGLLDVEESLRAS
jgi:hypothetical protein